MKKSRSTDSQDIAILERIKRVAACLICAESTALVLLVCTNGEPNLVVWMRRL